MSTTFFASEPSRLYLLRQVEVALSQCDSPKVALSNALQLLLPNVCQQGVLEIDELDGNASIVTAFSDPALERLAIEIHRRYPPKPTVHAAGGAARAGETRFHDVTEELMESIAHDREHLALLRQFQATQLLVQPLRRHGRALGVLVLSTDHGRRFTVEDRVLAELVASRIAVHLDTAYLRRRMLLVEDDPAHRNLLRRTLVAAGLDVCEAETGAEALRLAQELRPDVILLDVSPPDLGFEVRKQLEADERTASIPVIQLANAERCVSARAHGARELLHANARLRAITESGLLGTFEWGSDGVILDASDGFLEMVGRTREDVLSRRLALTALFADPAMASEARMAAPLVAERDLIGKDGKPVTVLFGRTPIPELPGRGVAFVLDVSEQRRRSELEALLIGIVSHDLRNPLGVVTMAASLLLSQELTETQRKLAHRIEAAGRKSARLISDLLDFTVVRGAGIQISPEPSDLHDVVAQAVEDLHATWPGRTIAHDRVGEALTHIDQARVEQIAVNLIGNALQHSPATSTVRIETTGDVDSVTFSVRNEGRPISGELIAQLFAPLRRGGNAGYRRGSIGLGLYIAQHLVEAHGGSIDVASNEADGTCFRVRLPRFRPVVATTFPPGDCAALPA
jgi:signal transduction histidine kinase